MTQRTWWMVLAACLAGASAGGCASKSTPTQIVVTVDSDLDVPDELDRVEIDVRGAVHATSARADLSTQALPRHLTLVHEGGPLGPIVVHATGYLADAAVVEHSARVSFVRGEIVELDLKLERACVMKECGPDATCEQGRCRALSDGSPVNVDAGGADAGTDGGSMDAGAADGGGDAGASDAGDAGDAGGTDAGASDAGDAGGGDASTPANQPPGCTIARPTANQSFVAGQTLRLEGSCTDPEDGRITQGLSWSSDVDGALGTGAARDALLTSAGTHVISLCAYDKGSPPVQGCATVEISVSLPPAPTASIDGVTQAGSSAQPFDSSAPVLLMGSGSGQQISYAWLDSLAGALGSSAQLSLANPPVGRHQVTLRVVDNVSQSASDSTDFVVVPAGETTLAQAFGDVATTLGAAGGARADALAADSQGNALVANPAPAVYAFDGEDPSATATLALDSPPLADVTRAIAIAESNGLIYFATKNGLTVCDYSTSSGIDSGACDTYSGGQFPDDDTSAVARAHSDGTDYLIVGTKAGLLSTTSTGGSATGSKQLDGHDVAGLAAGSGGRVWVATRDAGLYSFDPAAGETRAAQSGGPSQALEAVAVASDGGVWVGSQNGLGRYDPEARSWQIWRVLDPPAPGLVSNTIRCLAISQVTLSGTQRDVVWIGTDAGVSRFDRSIPSFMTLDSADGLPSDSVRSIALLPDGSKLIGTDAGIARYIGP